jgi:hypothetical protein
MKKKVINTLYIFISLVLMLFVSCNDQNSKEDNKSIQKENSSIDNKRIIITRSNFFEVFGPTITKINLRDSFIELNDIVSIIPIPMNDVIKKESKYLKIDISKSEYMRNTSKNWVDISYFSHKSNDSLKYFCSVIIDERNYCIYRAGLSTPKKNGPNRQIYFYVKNDSIEKEYISMGRKYYEGIEMADEYSMKDFYAEKKKYLPTSWKNPNAALEVWY